MWKYAIMAGALLHQSSINVEPPETVDCLRLKAEGTSFLTNLRGAWEGATTQSPIGQVPYEIEFENVERGIVRGRSYTNGAAIHTWSFRSGDRGLMVLDFHSTFGDSHAKDLCLTKTHDEKGYLFSGGVPEFLKVWTRISSVQDRQIWEADILLYDKPHVKILATKRADH